MEKMSVSEAKALSPLTLAFFGDSVYEVLVRQKIVMQGSKPSQKLHKAAVSKVRASYQSAGVDLIENMLTETEADILRRGRNANGISAPNSCSPREYRRATALEALFGFLYLVGENERMEQLFEVIYNGGEKETAAECTD